MSIWNEGEGRVDRFIRSSDRTLNVLVAALLVALSLTLTAYYYGQLNPRAQIKVPTQSPSSVTAPAAN